MAAMQQADDMEDVDIPTIMAISNFTGVWCSDYRKYLSSTQAHCNEAGQPLVNNNLEFFGLIIYGILRIHGFKLKDLDDSDQTVIPWRCDPITKSFIKLQLIHSEYPPNWIFTVKITSLFANNYIMTINANLIHTITKLPNVQNWKLVFKISSKFDYNALMAEAMQSPLSSSFAQLIGNQIYQTFLKNFWNLWLLHLQNINELTDDEDKIIHKFNANKQYLDSFQLFQSNSNRNQKLPFSQQTLRHIYLAFLCHIILQHLQWESLGITDEHNTKSKAKRSDKEEADDEEDEDEDKEAEEQKADTIDDDKLYGATPQNPDEDKDHDNDVEMKPKHDDGGVHNNNAMSNDVVATTITRCMRSHRPFDMNYKIMLPNGKNFKYSKIRYISMEHCALVIVNDQELIKCNLASPKVRLALNMYVSESGEIKNLSGRHSLIKLLCENIVRRARDPLSTTSTSLGLMSSKVFSIDILVILFGFMQWRDLLHFGYCSQVAYNISNDGELWKLMYEKEFGLKSDKEEMKFIVNWKNKFLSQYLQRKSGEDEATLALIQQLLAGN